MLHKKSWIPVWDRRSVLSRFRKSSLSGLENCTENQRTVAWEDTLIVRRSFRALFCFCGRQRPPTADLMDEGRWTNGGRVGKFTAVMSGGESWMDGWQLHDGLPCEGNRSGQSGLDTSWVWPVHLSVSVPEHQTLLTRSDNDVSFTLSGELHNLCLIYNFDYTANMYLCFAYWR